MEAAFIDLLRAFATDPAARGLMDDAALLEMGGARLVITQDAIVEGVHFRGDDTPADIGWKLAAVNLSDLAAKGARPVACLMSYALSGDSGWDEAFLGGLNAALTGFAMPLIGGDTVRMPAGSARSFTLTAIGEAGADVPARGGAKAGDGLYVTGPVGDAGAGLALLEAGATRDDALVGRYLRPAPRLDAGRLLAPHVHAMMDISDGLLIDAARMAEASGLAAKIDMVPLSAALVALRGDGIEARLTAATAGDDYELLFAAAAPVAGVAAIRVGSVAAGSGISLTLEGQPVPLPASLGYSH